MNSFLRFALFSIWFCFLVVSARGENVFVVPSQPETRVSLRDYLTVFEDTASQFSPQIVFTDTSIKFGENIPSNRLNAKSSSVLWVNLDYKNDYGAHEVYFEFARTDSVEAFFVNTNGTLEKVSGGYGISDSVLSVSGNPRYVKVNLLGHTQNRIMFRFIFHYPFSFSDPVLLYYHTEKTFVSGYTSRALIFGVFTGAGMLMIVLLLLFYRSFKDTNFINLIICIASFTAYFAFTKDIVYDLWPSSYRLLWLLTSVVAFGVFSYTLFISTFLHLRKLHPILYYLTWFPVVVIIVDDCFLAFFYSLITIRLVSNLSGLLWLIMLTISLIVYIREKRDYSRYISFAVLMSVVTFLVQLFMFEGLLEDNLLTSYSPVFANAVQFIVFSYALIDHVLTLRTEKIFYELKAQKSELEKQYQLNEARKKIASDLHDDVGSTLSSIRIISTVAENSQQQLPEAIKKIRESTQRMLDNLSDIVWAVNPDNDTMEQMMVRMNVYASQVLEIRNIDFTFDVDESVSRMSLPMDKRRDVYLVFKEALNNIVKYSECDKVEIRIFNSGENVLLKITDNGRGFEVAPLRPGGKNTVLPGNGLMNMRKRAANLGGALDIVSAPGQGTAITLQVPVVSPQDDRMDSFSNNK